jgi:non-homologous end joining protein Ku
MKRIEELATKGRTHVVRQPGQEEGGAQIIDLMAALKRSLDRKDDKGGAKAPPERDAAPRQGGKRAAATKTRSARTTRAATRKRA